MGGVVTSTLDVKFVNSCVGLVQWFWLSGVDCEFGKYG